MAYGMLECIWRKQDNNMKTAVYANGILIRLVFPSINDGHKIWIWTVARGQLLPLSRVAKKVTDRDRTKHELRNLITVRTTFINIGIKCVIEEENVHILFTKSYTQKTIKLSLKRRLEISFNKDDAQNVHI